MNVILQLIIILVVLVGGICIVSIPTAFLLLWLDSKGVIDKITKIAMKILRKKEKEQ